MTKKILADGSQFAFTARPCGKIFITAFTHCVDTGTAIYIWGIPLGYAGVLRSVTATDLTA